MDQLSTEVSVISEIWPNPNFNIKEITIMQFNYGYEKKKFDAAWKQLAKTYEEAGMSAEAIQAMYEYDCPYACICHRNVTQRTPGNLAADI